MLDTCPDLWGVHSRLDAIRANAARDCFAAWWEAHLAELRQSLQEPLTPATGDAEAIRKASATAQDNAFAALLTEDEGLAARALEALRWVRAAEGRWLAAGHAEMYPQDPADLTTAEITKACANAVSWLWPRLSATETEAYLSMIADRGGAAIYEGAMKGCWWGNALNSNWTAVLNSGLAFAALAAGRLRPEVSAQWLAFARARTVEMLDLAAEEAAGVEGAGYWLYCFGSLQDIVEALRNVQGDDLYAHPFWSRCSRFLPYLALPDMSAWVNYADTGYKGLGGSHFFHGVASRLADPLAQWFGDEVLRRHGGANFRSLLYHDPAVPSEPIDREPTCRVFGSIHLASFRSGWDEDATFMLFKGGSNAWTHTHLDLNHFFIYSRGERLAAEPGPEPYSLSYWHSIQPVVSTAWHNCIVVDGAHQRVGAQYAMSLDLEEAGDCYSRFSDHLSAPGIEMVHGDATSAYADSLELATRDVVYLHPNVFIIHDDLQAHPVRAQRNFEWMLHSECPVSEVEGGLQVKGQRARLVVEPVFPDPWEYKAVEGRYVPHADRKPLHCISLRPYWHHKWNVDPTRSPYPHWDSRCDSEELYDGSCRYLVVLSAVGAEEAAPYAAEGFAHGLARGVTLRSGEETAVVLFNPGRDAIRCGDLETDAERLVLRDRGGRLSWAMVRGTCLTWQGRAIVQERREVSRAGG